MRRNLCVFALLTLITAAVLPSAARAENYVSHFKGLTGYASASSVDPTGCIYSYVDVAVYESRYQNSPSRPDEYGAVEVYIFQYDSCQYLYLNDIFGYAQLPAGAFDTRGGLQSARLVTTLDGYNYQTGATVPISINLTWTGVGDVSRGGSSYRSNYPHYRFMSHSVGSSRFAEAVGTLLVGTETVTFDQSAWASLSQNQSGTVSVSH